MTKISLSDRERAVKLVIEGRMSAGSAAKEVGSHKSQVQKWVKLFDEHGIEGLSIKHGTYSGETKVSIVRYMLKNHLSLCETAGKFGIPEKGTISKWLRVYQDEGEAALYRNNRGRMKTKTKPTKRCAEVSKDPLLVELEYLRTENAYLKKLKALVEQRITRESGKEPKPSKN